MTFYKKNNDTHKECNRCKKFLDRSLFYKDSSRKDGITAYCKECKLEINNAWRENNPEKMRESQRNTRRKIEYGVDGDKYDRMLIDQDYKCAICLVEIGREAAVDHCHKTLVVRGILCRTCNAGLGMFKDDIILLQSAADYLKK